MEANNIKNTVEQFMAWLTKEGYCEAYKAQYQRTTDQLLKFMDSAELTVFSTDVGFRFLEECYGYTPQMSASQSDKTRIRLLQMLSEFQIHGTPMRRGRVRAYKLPDGFREATEHFLAHRRFTGILENNMSNVSLYLERFFGYLGCMGVQAVSEISGEHIRGFLVSLTGFGNSTKDHTMRTVRQFIEYCFKNGYHPEELTEYAPVVHYEKHSKLPSAYSGGDVAKLITQIDRSNPVGRRNYAIVLLIVRLGLRAGDVANLCFGNINWGENRISLTQHKTGRLLTLPLLEDVGLAIIDYLKYGRPRSDSQTVFLRHRAPIDEYTAGGIYSMVSSYITKAGLQSKDKKRGPHALRHSLASRLLEGNVPLPVISEILGHANTDTTAVYLSIDIDKLRVCSLEV